METPLVVLGSLTPLLLAAAIIARPIRRPIGLLLLLTAGLALTHSLTAPETELTRKVYHLFQGFTDLEPGGIGFEVHQANAPAGRWSLILAGWLAVTGLLAVLTGGGTSSLGANADPKPAHPWLAPLGLALGGVGVNMLLENAAAPNILVYPIPLERILVPAILAAGIQMAKRNERFLPIFFQLTAFQLLVRGIVALTSYKVSTDELGSSLDIHRVTEISNPMNQRFTELIPHSIEQHGWLIWGPHLIVMPALYMMSIGSLTFCVFMFFKHPARPQS